jgi:hypothetical protein
MEWIDLQIRQDILNISDKPTTETVNSAKVTAARAKAVAKTAVFVNAPCLEALTSASVGRLSPRYDSHCANNVLIYYTCA